MEVDPLIRALFRALVAKAGGQEAATAILRARFGEASAGQVSKMCGGSVGVTVSAMAALEDALGDTPLTDYLALRAMRSGPGHVPGSLAGLAGMAAMASGQAQMALAQALDEAGPGGSAVTAEERGQIGAAAVRMREAAEAMLRVCGADAAATVGSVRVVAR